SDVFGLDASDGIGRQIRPHPSLDAVGLGGPSLLRRRDFGEVAFEKRTQCCAAFGTSINILASNDLPGLHVPKFAGGSKRLEGRANVCSVATDFDLKLIRAALVDALLDANDIRQNETPNMSLCPILSRILQYPPLLPSRHGGR